MLLATSRCWVPRASYGSAKMPRYRCVVRQNAWTSMCCTRHYALKELFSLRMCSVSKAIASARELRGTPGGQQRQHTVYRPPWALPLNAIVNLVDRQGRGTPDVTSRLLKIIAYLSSYSGRAYSVAMYRLWIYLYKIVLRSIMRSCRSGPMSPVLMKVQFWHDSGTMDNLGEIGFWTFRLTSYVPRVYPSKLPWKRLMYPSFPLFLPPFPFVSPSFLRSFPPFRSFLPPSFPSFLLSLLVPFLEPSFPSPSLPRPFASSLPSFPLLSLSPTACKVSCPLPYIANPLRKSRSKRVKLNQEVIMPYMSKFSRRTIFAHCYIAISKISGKQFQRMLPRASKGSSSGASLCA